MAFPLTIAQAAYEAGVRSPGPLAQAVAVALAESGGNERAHNAVPPDDSYGLWQINMLGSLGPARRTQFGITSNEQLYDIATNAKAMAAISSGGTNWKPWSTFQGARYWLAYPGSVVVANSVIAAKGAAGVAESVTEPISDAVDAARQAVGGMQQAAVWLSDRNNWFRVAKVMAGLSLVVGGVLLASKPMQNQALDSVLKPVKGLL